MHGARNLPRCGVCENKLVKNGKTSAGRTRWRCKNCGASSTQTRETATRKAQFRMFQKWLESNQPRHDFDTSTRSFTRHTQWCWNVAPSVVPTGEIHHQIMLDGTYFNGWCVLIALTGTHVIDWQWCDREKLASWTALLTRIPPPDYAIIDGNGPLHRAIKNCWPHTRIQRCYFHIRNTAHRHLTRTPKLPANKELLALYKALSKVQNTDQAAAWTAGFLHWEATWNTFLKQRTYATKKHATTNPRKPAPEMVVHPHPHQTCTQTLSHTADYQRAIHLAEHPRKTTSREHNKPARRRSEQSHQRLPKKPPRTHHQPRPPWHRLDTLQSHTQPQRPLGLRHRNPLEPTKTTHPHTTRRTHRTRRIRHRLHLRRRHQTPTRMGRKTPLTRQAHTHFLAYNPGMHAKGGPMT